MSLAVAPRARSFVFERLVPGTFFLLFAVAGVLASEPETVLQWARVAVNTCFIGLIGYLYLVRLPRLGERSPLLGAVVGLAGTFAPVALAIAPIRDSETLLVVGTVVSIVGLAISVVALATLGRCFGIFPEVRGLVTRGLYRWVRHPLYLGEYVAVGGILISAISPLALLVYVSFLALQAWRALNEERALVAVFPEYEEYSQRTARIIPFVW